MTSSRLSANLYAYTFLEDLILLYPFYPLLFADTGLSTAEISSLFIIWSVTSIAFEVPSGVWADAVSRRLLLAIAPALGAAGYALWTFAPAYWAFALGFVLWGMRGALTSGALEALVYDELDRVDASHHYAKIMGRARALSTIALLASTATAAPVFASGGYTAIGLASVLVCLLSVAAGLAFPEHRTPPLIRPRQSSQSPDSERQNTAYSSILARCEDCRELVRGAWREARRDRSVRRALLLIPAISAIWGGLEEYDALLAADTGVDRAVVPLLLLIVSVGTAAGGLSAGMGDRLSARTLAWILAIGAIVAAAGAMSGQAIGFVPLALGFWVFQMITVVADARLQRAISGPSRATVTSLAGIATDLAVIGLYAAYGAASAVAGHNALFAVFLLIYVAVAVPFGRQ